MFNTLFKVIRIERIIIQIKKKVKEKGDALYWGSFCLSWEYLQTFLIIKFCKKIWRIIFFLIMFFYLQGSDSNILNTQHNNTIKS